MALRGDACSLSLAWLRPLHISSGLEARGMRPTCADPCARRGGGSWSPKSPLLSVRRVPVGKARGARWAAPTCWQSGVRLRLAELCGLSAPLHCSKEVFSSGGHVSRSCHACSVAANGPSSWEKCSGLRAWAGLDGHGGPVEGVGRGACGLPVHLLPSRARVGGTDDAGLRALPKRASFCTKRPAAISSRSAGPQLAAGVGQAGVVPLWLMQAFSFSSSLRSIKA